MKRVLIYSKANGIRDFIEASLKRSNYEISLSDDNLPSESYVEDRLIIIYVVMNGELGHTTDFVERVRNSSKAVGIVLITQIDSEILRISSLEAGADDFIRFPISGAELTARIDALWRRVENSTEVANPGIIEKFGENYSIDHSRRTFTLKGKEIRLTLVEHRMLLFLLKNPEVTVSRQELQTAVWDTVNSEQGKIVDVNISRLRAKIEDEPKDPLHLITVWKQGYKWVP